MVKFFPARGVGYDLVKTKSVQVCRCKSKDNINETFARYDVSDSLLFSAYHDHVFCMPYGDVTYGLVLLYEMIKVIPDLRRFVFKPVRERS